jgi:GDPmannose 4,6-dehydratase
MPRSRRTALIFGVNGQDGAYLTRLLLSKGYSVHGTSRDKDMSTFGNLERLGVKKDTHLHSATIGDFRSVLQAIKEVNPTEIYSLAGQTSVGLSFSQPVDTVSSLLLGTINILEAIRFLEIDARFYNASSGECFGNTPIEGATETMQFHPRSPYGVGKAGAYWATANYRESYNLFACSGLLFNHESPLRPVRFVTQKIVRGAIDIHEKKIPKLKLGNLSVTRDWGWAEEYVEAMWLMLQAEHPEDYVIATGATSSLESFVATAFEYFGLNWRNHVEVDASLVRPSDISTSIGNPTKAKTQLGWEAKTQMRGVVQKLIEAELEYRKSDARA